MEKTEKNILKYIFYFAIIIFCVSLSCLNNIPDNDLWARIIAGGNVIENHSIIKYDFLSYTPTHIWYDHEWGSSVIFYTVLKYFGDAGLIILKGLLAAITLIICYKTVELRKPESTIPYNILYFVFMYLAVHNVLGSTIRCLLFTCLFFALFIYILEKYRKSNNWKYLIWLPVIMLFWGNMHGGCISGLGILGIYILGEFLNKKPVKNYIYTLIVCFIVLFINPYGFEYVKFLFFAAGMDRGIIKEWASPFERMFLLTQLRYKMYLAVMLLTGLISFISKKKNNEQIDKTKILVILAVTYLSIMHIRHEAFFIFTAGTFLYDDFYKIFNSLLKKVNFIKNEEITKSLVLIKEIFVYTLILFISLPPLLIPNKQIRITETKYPRYAIEFIKINKLKGNLFINFDWGSYAAYKLYPDNLIAMDGRYEEVYNPDLIMKLRDFHMLKGDWYKIIKDYKTDVIVIENHYPVYNEMLKHPDWKLVFENNLSGVFVPAETVKDEYLLPIPVDDYYNQTLFNTNAIKR